MTKDKSTIKIMFIAKGQAVGIYDRLQTMKHFDDNASLRALCFDGGKLSQNFKPEHTEYTLDISEKTTEIVMSIVPENQNALIYVNDILIDDALPRTVSIQGQMTLLNIAVKAEDYITQKEYRITILKVEKGGS
jgi:hypothetical protein